MRIRRMLKRVPWWVKYILIFCTGMLVMSIVYPYIEEWCMATRERAVPGGEMLLWLVPFMVCVGISTAKQWKIKKQGVQKNEC